MVSCPKCFHEIQTAVHESEDAVRLYCNRCNEDLGEFVRKGD